MSAAMDQDKNSTQSMAQHLIETIEQVGDHCWKVWTGALMRFASPVPVYEPGRWSLSAPSKPALVPAQT
jgi:hypothetical protein